MLPTPNVGHEVIFSTDPLAEAIRVTPLADDTFILAWDTALGDIEGRHLDETGSFTTGNFLQSVSDSARAILGGPVSTPLVVQERSGAIMTEFDVVPGGGTDEIALHPVDPNFSNTTTFFIPKASSAGEFPTQAVPTFQGTAVAYQQDGAGFDVHTFIRWYGPDGLPTPTDQQLGNPGETGSQFDAKLLPSGTDLVYAVYTHFDPATGNRDVRFQDLNPNFKDNAISLSGVGGNPDFADIADLGDGTFIVVWQDSQGVIVKHILFNGITLETARVTDANGGFLPKVVALQDGSFIIAWTAASGTESDGSPNEDIFLRRFVIVPQSPGSSINIIADTGFLVHLTEPGDQGLFQMSMSTLADGRVLLAYGSETGDATNVNNLVYRIIDPRDPTVTGTANADVLTATPTASTINGLGGNDKLIGLDFNDILNGGDGNDTLAGGLGNDTLDGGAGVNTAAFNHVFQAVTVDLTKGTATGQGTDTLKNIQNVTGSGANDTIIGSAGNNVIDGGGGIDTVRFNGVAAAVTVNLTTGTATGQGSDTLLNIENVIGSNLNDTITGSAGNNVIDGGAGIDTVRFDGVAAAVTVNLVKGTATGQGTDTLRNIENVIGSNLNDTLTGNAGNNVINGAAGIDTVRFDGVAAAVTVDLTKGTATGQGADTLLHIENVVGSNLADTITGSSVGNVLDGKGGADILAGLDGNDTYFVDNAADMVQEAAGAGNDTVLASVSYKLAASQSIEKLQTTNSASTAAINLTGNELSQTIIGNAGMNFIDGGRGNDTLTGLGGSDTFVFSTPLSATTNVDRITDLAPSSDKIRLDKSVFAALATTGVLPDSAFFIGSAAHDADDGIVYNSSTGSLIYDSNGNAAGGATTFAVLQPGLALHAGNFVVA